MIKQARIDHLEARVKKIEQQIDKLRGTPVCPKCGGEISRSTRYGSTFCLQEFGYCGFLMMHDLGNWKRPKPWVYYVRTTVLADGKLRAPSKTEQAFLLKFFVAGHEVSREEYYGFQEAER